MNRSLILLFLLLNLFFLESLIFSDSKDSFPPEEPLISIELESKYYDFRSFYTYDTNTLTWRDVVTETKNNWGRIDGVVRSRHKAWAGYVDWNVVDWHKWNGYKNGIGSFPNFNYSWDWIYPSEISPMKRETHKFYYLPRSIDSNTFQLRVYLGADEAQSEFSGIYRNYFYYQDNCTTGISKFEVYFDDTLYKTIEFDEPNGLNRYHTFGSSLNREKNERRCYFFRAAYFDVPIEDAPANIRVVVYDFAGNQNEKTITNLIADLDPPSIISTDTLYTADDEDFLNATFDMVQTFSVSDSGVGIDYSSIFSDNFPFSNESLSDADETNLEALLSERGTTDNPLFKLRLLNFNRDNKYKIWGQVSDKLDNTCTTVDNPVFFGLTANPCYDTFPSIIITDSGEFQLDLSFSLGRYFADDDIGYSSLSTYLDSNSICSLDNSKLKEIYNSNSTVLVSDNKSPEYVFKSSMDRIIFVNKIGINDLDLIPHSQNLVFSNAIYNNGRSENTDESILTLPNKRIDKTYNNVAIKLSREIGGFRYTDTFNSSKSQTNGLPLIDGKDDLIPRELFYTDSFELSVVGKDNNVGYDLEGDELYLSITTKTNGTFDPIPCFKGPITFKSDGSVLINDEPYTLTINDLSVDNVKFDSITNISIIEKYNEVDGLTEKIINENVPPVPYPTEMTIKRDTNLFKDLISSELHSEDQKNHTWESGQVVASNDGEFTYNINFSEGFSDTSGIQEITLFEYGDHDSGPVTFDDYYYSSNNKKKIFESSGDDQPNYVSESPYIYTLNLDDIEEGIAKETNIGIYIQDFAGNYKLESQKVYYDKVSPQHLISSDPSTVQWYQENQSARIQFSTYDVVNNSLVLNLNLEDGLYKYLEACTIVPFSSSSYIDGEVSINETQNTITIPLISTFPSDEPIDLKLTFADYAGNVTENNLTLYTPFYFAEGETESDYITRTDTEWDEVQEHYLGWTQNPSFTNGLVLYRQLNAIEKEEITELDGFGDFVHNELPSDTLPKPDLVAHGTYDYILHGRNRSGYESDFNSEIVADRSEILFSRTLKNNPPMLIAYEEEDTCWTEGEEYFGPKTGLTLRYKDYDETDSHTLTYFVNGTPVNAEEISGIKEFSLTAGDYFSGLEDDEPYTIRYEIQDQWDDNGTLVTGPVTDILSADHPYRYDSTEPDLPNYTYDQREGFAYIYGDIHLNVLEESSGIRFRKLYKEADALNEVDDGTELTDGDALEGHTHLVSSIPESGETTFYLKMVDGVGNTNTKQIGPFSRDATSPVLSSVELDAASAIFSRPTIPAKVDWSDNLSGASKILFRFTNGSEVLKEGEVAPDGDLICHDDTGSSGLWSVICSASGFQLDDTQSFKLYVKVLDNAGNGNEADWSLVSSDLIIDSSAPVVEITGKEGFVFNEGQNYLSSQSGVEISHHITDSNPSSDIWYERTDKDGNITSSSSISTLMSGLNDGEKYSLLAASKDKAGNTGRSSSISFIKDSQLPDANSLVLEVKPRRIGANSYSKQFSQGQQLRFSFHAEDAHSGIDKFYIWLGQDIDGVPIPVISQLLPGHVGEEGLVEMDYIEGKDYCINLPVVPAGNYIFRASAVDMAGNRTDLKLIAGQTLSYIDSVESLTVNDFATYSNNTEKLSAWWEYKGEKNVNHYAYRVIESTDNSPVSEWKYTFDKFGSVSFPDGLTADEIYYFEVYTGFEDGSQSYSSYSPGCRIDRTAPVITNVTVPSYGTLSDLKVDWDAADDSVIGEVTAILETYQTDADGNIVLEEVEQDGHTLKMPVREELGLYPLGTGSTGRTVQVLDTAAYNSLDIADGQRLLLTLRVSDIAGNIIQEQAPIFIKDSSAPPIPVVLDGGEYVNPKHNKVSFDWQWSRADRHSGIKSYEYQILLPNESVSDEKLDCSIRNIPRSGRGGNPCQRKPDCSGPESNQRCRTQHSGLLKRYYY